MALFDRFKSGYVGWKQAYTAIPNVYKNPDGSIFGAIALSEHTRTIIPRLPQDSYKLETGPIEDWKLVLVSTTMKGVIGECNYFKALQKLKKYIEAEQGGKILIRELSLTELDSLSE